MGAKETVELFYVEDIRKAENPEEFKQKKIQEYIDRYANPFQAVSVGTYIEDVIEPRETRRRIIQAMQLLSGKRGRRYHPKKHGNIPL